ncbi:cation:proton antiporter [Alkalinema sp. FACHB-956]|uniref:cation:proton antiporter domain-containing protein n=1 Tax=Alkalinema sp. FACHB-956 TaxID=2692768 RepID=UPI001688D2B2|nr:cation:proton antiporter [Alkalinema sp. FACHB-956]MBD2329580.1 cation:proton antiporter [Alkalinema sp. FACHB-956]
MANQLDLIGEMVVVLGAATLGGAITHRLRQPVLLGYLISGIVVGPAGLQWVGQSGDIQVLAEIGVALLLFALGVEFSLRDLLRMRTIALGGGSLQIFGTILLGGGLAYLTGWVESIPQALFLGAVLSLSSTAVVLKSLIERNEIQTSFGQIMLAILIVQDLSLGIMLAILPTLSYPQQTIGISIAAAILKVLLFLTVSAIVGKWSLPPIIQKIVRTGSSELFLLSLLVLCLGIANLTHTLGLGTAMGAFVAGLMISNIEYADHALDRVLPMRDVFATLFFASIGLLIDPRFLLAHAVTLLGLVTVVMLGKAAIVIAIIVGFRYSLKTAITVGFGINQIGEFSFVLAGVAKSQGLFSEDLYGLTVGTTAVTLLMAPFMLKIAPIGLRYLEQSPWFNALTVQPEPQIVGAAADLKDHIVVAGYGRVGQTLVRMLYFQGHALLVIDNNESALGSLRQQGIPYLFGDASSPLILEKAHLPQAKSMAITLPDPIATRLTIARALSLVPDLDVTVRAHINEEIESFYQLGANEVVQPEFEAALEMGAHMLLKLGTTPQAVQQTVNRYRNGRYRDILPARADYWGWTDLETMVSGLNHQWYTLSDNCSIVGQTLAQSNIRRHTGATIMAIDRQNQVLRYPTGETCLQVGDRLLVVGTRETLQGFERTVLAPMQPPQSPES